MKSFRPWMSIVACLLVLSLTADAQLKKRVAVARFQDRTGSGYHSLGEGLADMLATALVKSGKFSILERQDIERVIKEQQFGQSFMVTPETAPKVGQILGVELMVVGSVTEFGTKKSTIGGATSLFGGGITKQTARCAVDIRLVNTTTGEVVAAETKEGSESTTGFSVNLQQVDFSNVNSWDDTDIGKAAREAVNGVVEMINDNMSKIPWAGKVLKVNTDGTLLMKPGTDGGVAIGDEFTIFRKGEEIKDPDTGLSMGAEETKVGRIKVAESALAGKAAKAKILEGTDLKVGDIIRQK